MSSLFTYTHNVVAILEKSDAAEGFEQIIDFLSGSYIHYALIVNHHIYISCIKQFWNTASVKRSCDVTRLQALVDKKKIMIFEVVIREILQLDDAEGVVCLPNEEIFIGLAQMGYEKPTSENKFSTSMASAVICLSKGQRFNFSKYIFDSLNQVGDLSTHTTRFISPAMTQKVFANMRRVGKGFSGVETPLFEGMLAVRQPAEAQVQVDDAVAAAVEENELTNQEMLDSKAYKTYYTFASREKNPKPKYVRKKADSDISPKHKPVQATKGTRLKTKAKVAKFDKKKQPAKKPKAKGLAVLSAVALTEAKQLKMSTKRSKKQFQSSYVSGSGDGVDTQSKVPDEKHLKITDEIPDPNMTNVDQTELKEEDIDKRVHTPLDYEFTNDEKIHDEENIDEEEEDEVTKELDADVNSGFEQEEEDAHMTLTPILDTHKTGGLTQSSFVSSDFTRKILNLDNPSPADNEIASLMDTIAHHATTIPKITSNFTTHTHSLPLFFNPLSQQATPTLISTASETTTSHPALLDFAYVFKFNERIFNLEKYLSEMKQVDQYAKALSPLPAIVDRYMDNKLGEAINKAIQAHNFNYKEEA
nr:hypothetical protein [Tanacetum cinerariifolium]